MSRNEPRYLPYDETHISYMLRLRPAIEEHYFAGGYSLDDAIDEAAIYNDHLIQLKLKIMRDKRRKELEEELEVEQNTLKAEQNTLKAEQNTLEEEQNTLEEEEEDWNEREWDVGLTWKEMNEAEWKQIYEDDERIIEDYFQQRWKNWY